MLLGACSPGHIVAQKAGKAEWAWVGCHIVMENPSEVGEYAIGIDDLSMGDRLYFKQVSNDGTVGPVTTGIPCL